MKDKGGQFDKKVVFAYYFTYLLNGKAVIVFIYSIIFNMWYLQEPALYLLEDWQHMPAMLTLIEYFLIRKLNNWMLIIFNIK